MRRAPSSTCGGLGVRDPFKTWVDKGSIGFRVEGLGLRKLRALGLRVSAVQGLVLRVGGLYKDMQRFRGISLLERRSFAYIHIYICVCTC